MMTVRLLQSGEGVDWTRLIQRVGADTGALPRLQNRDRITVILVENLPSPAASILKQCMLSGGADALVHREVLTCRTDYSDGVVYGTPSTIRRGCDSLDGQPFGLGSLGADIRELLTPTVLPSSLVVNGRQLPFRGRPLIMGILNTTPDSFSDGGTYGSSAEAAGAAVEMERSGASIIDVGGESTRPGALPVDPEEQMNRVIPVIEGIRERSGVPVSIDTRIPEVASAAVAAGAGLINSIDGMETPGMAKTAASLQVPVCVMHMKGTPGNMQDHPEYGDAPGEIGDYLLERVEYLESAGIKRENILVDPGIGFGKRLEDNIELLRSLEWIRRRTACRVLLGHSRKSFLGRISGIDQPRRRDFLSHIVSVLAVGADVLRVHDVPGTKASLDLAERMGVFR